MPLCALIRRVNILLSMPVQKFNLFIVDIIISRLDNECIIVGKILNSFIHIFLPLMCRLHFRFEQRTLIVIY